MEPKKRILTFLRSLKFFTNPIFQNFISSQSFRFLYLLTYNTHGREKNWKQLKTLFEKNRPFE